MRSYSYPHFYLIEKSSFLSIINSFLPGSPVFVITFFHTAAFHLFLSFYSPNSSSFCFRTTDSILRCWFLFVATVDFYYSWPLTFRSVFVFSPPMPVSTFFKSYISQLLFMSHSSLFETKQLLSFAYNLFIEWRIEVDGVHEIGVKFISALFSYDSFLLVARVASSNAYKLWVDSFRARIVERIPH